MPGVDTSNPHAAADDTASAPPLENPLSEREMDVARLLVTGATNAEIARELVIAPSTAKVHVRNVFDKLQVRSRTEATMVLLQRGWVTLPGVDVAQPSQEPAPLAPDPLPDLPATLRPWQRYYLAGALVICLLALLAPRLFGQPQSTTSLVSDGGRTVQGKPEVILQPRWEARTPLAKPRSRLASVLVGDLLFAIGGEGVNGETQDAVSAYDLSVNEWRTVAPLPRPLASAAAATIDDAIYVAGGSRHVPGDDDAIEVDDTLWRYDVESDTWQALDALPAPLAGASMVAEGDILYLMGGWDGSGIRDEVWRYVPSEGESAGWELVTEMASPAAFLGSAVVDGLLYVFGGYDGQQELDSAAAYDLATGEWLTLPSLSTPRSGHSVVYDGLAIFVLGGGWTKPLETHERFDPHTNEWSNFPSPIQGEWRNLAATPVDGRLHLIGGWGGDYLDTHLQYQSTFRALLPIITNE